MKNEHTELILRIQKKGYITVNDVTDVYPKIATNRSLVNKVMEEVVERYIEMQNDKEEKEITDMVRKFGYNVKMERIERGLSRKHASKIVGISERSWGDIEAGRANPSLKKVIAMSRALGVNNIGLLFL